MKKNWVKSIDHEIHDSIEFFLKNLSYNTRNLMYFPESNWVGYFISVLTERMVVM